MKRFLLVLLLVLLSANARAVQIEIGAGVSSFLVMGNGAYYENGANFPYTMRTNNFAFSVGLTGDIVTHARWGIAWHADYVHLGGVTVDATIDQLDANYDPSMGGCVGSCLGTMTEHASGAVQGIALTIEPHYAYGDFQFGVEAGPFIFRPTWSDTVYAPLATYTYSHQPLIQLGAVVGASVGRGNWALSYRYFFDRTRGGGPACAIWTGTSMLAVTYKF